MKKIFAIVMLAVLLMVSPGWTATQAQPLPTGTSTIPGYFLSGI